MTLPLHQKKRGQSRPVEPFTGSSASGQLLEINSSTPDSAGRGYGRCHPCTRQTKKTTWVPGMEKTITSKENKVDKANTKITECANEHNPHTYPKTSKVTSSWEIKRVLLEPHICGKNSPSNTSAGKRQKEPGTRKIPQPGSAPCFAP